MRQFERPKRDVDSAGAALRIKTLAWSLVALLIGAGFGALVAPSVDAPPLLVISAFAVGGFVLSALGGAWFGDRMAALGSSLYFSSGRTTPSRRDYSMADSLLVRDRVDEAVAELQRAASLYADDPEPCLRLARVLRDRCNAPEDAVRQFRAAIARSQDAAAEVAALREIIEIYTHRLKTPERALPDLARLSQRFPGSPAGEWARRELADIRSRMNRDG